MSKTRMSTLLGVIGLGLLAGCVSRTTIREKERVRSAPRVVEERTVVVPQPSVREETTVIERRRDHAEDE